MKGEPKTLQFMAEFRDMEKKMKLSDFPQMLKRANELFQSDRGGRIRKIWLKRTSAFPKKNML